MVLSRIFKVWLTVIACVFSVQVMFATSADDSIVNANNLFSKKQYEQSLDIYLKLYKSGYENASLLYNTGCAYFKSGDFVHAILFFERALLLDPNNEDIKFNLEVARAKQVDKLDVVPVFFFSQWVQYLGGIFSSNMWAIISIIFFIGTLILTYLFLFTDNVALKRTFFSVGLGILLLSIISISFSSMQANKLTVRKAAIVLTPSVTAKSTPDDGGTDLFLIHEGLKVTVIDNVSGWIKIKLSNGSVGWLKNSDIEII